MLDTLLSLYGNLPDEIKQEAYILYQMGFDMSAIEDMIDIRTKRY